MQYVIRTTRIDEIKKTGTAFIESYLLNFEKTPELSIDVETLTHLINEFDAYAKSLEGCGICYRLHVVKDKNEPRRKFKGFDTASQRGGALTKLVNRDIAIQTAIDKAQQSAQKQQHP
jgi:hypothetical protein